MKIPYRKMFNLPYGDTKVIIYQLIKNGEPYDLSNKVLWLGIINRYIDYEPVKLSINDEGWIINPSEGKFKIVLNTLRFNMKPSIYEVEIELEEGVNDFKTLVHYEVEVLKDVLHY